MNDGITFRNILNPKFSLSVMENTPVVITDTKIKTLFLDFIYILLFITESHSVLFF